MTRIVVDTSFAAQVSSLAEPVELCDASGLVLGYFTPSSILAKYDLTVPFTEEELARRRKETGGCTTDELLARLKAS